MLTTAPHSTDEIATIKFHATAQPIWLINSVCLTLKTPVAFLGKKLLTSSFRTG